MSGIEIYDDRVTVSGQQLAIRRIVHTLPAGGPDGPVLVFLHEGLGAMAFWKDVPERLCRHTGLDVLLYDRQGYGASDPMDLPRRLDYLHIEAHEFLPSLLARLEISETVPVGHSDGGTIALLFAARFPSMVRCMVTEAAHVFVDDVTVDGIRQAVQAWNDGHLRQVLETYHGKKTDTVFYSWSDTWLSEWFATWNITAELSDVVAPLLVMQGMDDQYGTRDQVDAIVRGTSGPADALLIKDCGHAPHADAPDVVVPEISRFVRRHLPRW